MPYNLQNWKLKHDTCTKCWLINHLSAWSKLVTFGHRLQKLVANISSQFYHLVNTGLAVGYLVKWLPIKVANPSKINKFEWCIARRLQMAPSDCNHLYHTMPCEILQPMVWGTSVKLLVLILETMICSCLANNFLEKLPKLVALQVFQSSYLSCGESLNHNTLSHYY